jgi:general stress protein YciG
MTDEKKPRGFAAMDPELRKDISSMGGRAAHATGKAHQWTQEEARAAGRRGGAASKGRCKGVLVNEK